MNYIQTEIDGVWLIEPRVFSDERGYFMEAYKKEEFEANIGPVNFIQDNESKSSFGVLVKKTRDNFLFPAVLLMDLQFWVKKLFLHIR